MFGGYGNGYGCGYGGVIIIILGGKGFCGGKVRIYIYVKFMYIFYIKVYMYLNF